VFIILILLSVPSATSLGKKKKPNKIKPVTHQYFDIRGKDSTLHDHVAVYHFLVKLSMHLFPKNLRSPCCRGDSSSSWFAVRPSRRIWISTLQTWNGLSHTGKIRI
jgi:hypothetical protein